MYSRSFASDFCCALGSVFVEIQERVEGFVGWMMCWICEKNGSDREIVRIISGMGCLE